jgi:hypothetical protein
MSKLYSAPVFIAPLAFAVLIGAAARSAELEGALQYPPASIGEDAQPPPPAMMVPRPMSPRRIELGVSGSSAPPRMLSSFIRPPIRWDGSGAPPPTGNGGN